MQTTRTLDAVETAKVFYNLDEEMLGVQFTSHKPHPAMLAGEIDGFPEFIFYFDRDGKLVALSAYSPYMSRSEGWTNRARRVLGSIFDEMRVHLFDFDFVHDHLTDDGACFEIIMTVDVTDEMEEALKEVRSELALRRETA